MKKFRLVMFIGNCENFGTEWEELREEIKIVEAESKEEVEERYNDTIFDCDCKSYYIEELGTPCFKVMDSERCIAQHESIENATLELKYYLYRFDDLKEAVGKVRIEIGILE